MPEVKFGIAVLDEIGVSNSQFKRDYPDGAVAYVPFTAIFKNGTEILRFIGYRPSGELVKTIQKYQQGA